jgi:hypothetical protein
MKSIYEVKVGERPVFPETWLFEAESLSAAVLKAESKIARGKKRYENWQVYRAGIVSGILCK